MASAVSTRLTESELFFFIVRDSGFEGHASFRMLRNKIEPLPGGGRAAGPYVMMRCVSCGEADAAVQIDWCPSQGPQSGVFCRRCARIYGSGLHLYGATVRPLSEEVACGESHL